MKKAIFATLTLVVLAIFLVIPAMATDSAIEWELVGGVERISFWCSEAPELVLISDKEDWTRTIQPTEAGWTSIDGIAPGRYDVLVAIFLDGEWVTLATEAPLRVEDDETVVAIDASGLVTFESNSLIREITLEVEGVGTFNYAFDFKSMVFDYTVDLGKFFSDGELMHISGTVGKFDFELGIEKNSQF